ncbi:metalloregulator ArsR/SmtB family transcription factor [Brucella pituitosa]|uniref:metalloregulator ArsR/SmtB family transcription factor n=1 Tax=Brucella pituitosa TaxID=571256 RepID=UPI0009A1F87D
MGSSNRITIHSTPAEQHAWNVAMLLHAMANDKRIQMLKHLLAKEMSVGALAQSVGLCQSATSQHLAKLNALHLTERRREGQTIYYRVTSNEVRRIIEICTVSVLAEPSKH